MLGSSMMSGKGVIPFGEGELGMQAGEQAMKVFARNPSGPMMGTGSQDRVANSYHGTSMAGGRPGGFKAVTKYRSSIPKQASGGGGNPRDAQRASNHALFSGNVPKSSSGF